MRALTTLLSVLPALGGGLAGVQTAEEVAQALVSEDATVRGDAEAKLVRLVPVDRVSVLAVLMADGSSRAVAAAERGFAALVAEATQPGQETLREGAALALAEQVKAGRTPRVRNHCASLLGVCGGDEVLPTLAAALQDPDTFEGAASALQRIPGRKATQTLLASLALAPGESQPALIRAVGARRDPAATPRLGALARGTVQPNRVAAIEALGWLGQRKSGRLLMALAREDEGPVREAAVGGLIALADTHRDSAPKMAAAWLRCAADRAVTEAQKQAALPALAGARRIEVPEESKGPE